MTLKNLPIYGQELQGGVAGLPLVSHKSVKFSVSPGFSGFRPPLMNDQLDINEIFLKGILVKSSE